MKCSAFHDAIILPGCLSARRFDMRGRYDETFFFYTELERDRME